MKKRILIALVLVLVLCAGAVPLRVLAAGKTGWQQEGDAWYYYENGSTVSGWKQIGGKWYWFNPKDGNRMVIGEWAIKADGGDYSDFYFFGPDGAMRTGWQKVGIFWKYYDASGKAVSGWQQISGKWYYFGGESGTVMYADRFFHDSDGYWYIFGSDGAMRTGWVQTGSSWYYCDASGHMATGLKVIGGKIYYFIDHEEIGLMWHGDWTIEGEVYTFGDDGALRGPCMIRVDGAWYIVGATGKIQTGWQYFGERWYYAGSDGKLVKGWKQIGGKWYWLSTYDYIMATNWKWIDDSWYYFDESGVMQTGWIDEDGWWSYQLPSGKGAVGWHKIGGVWYYFDEEGYMMTGYFYVGEKQYYCDSSGAMKTGWVRGFYADGVTDFWTYQLPGGESAQGWQQIGGKWYYFKGPSVDFMMTRSELKQIGDKWYYFDASGAMKTGWVKLDSVWHYFLPSGEMVKGRTIMIDGVEYSFDDQGHLGNG